MIDDRIIRAGALAAWRARFKTEPTDPLDRCGGALDPDAWCVQLALAIVEAKPLPVIAKDVPTLPEHPAVVAAAEAMGVTYYPAAAHA